MGHGTGSYDMGVFGRVPFIIGCVVPANGKVHFRF